MLSEEQAARFKMAMMKLELEPRLEDWQMLWVDKELLRGMDKAVDQKAAIRRCLAKEEAGAWPRLTNIVDTSYYIETPEKGENYDYDDYGSNDEEDDEEGDDDDDDK